MPSQQLNNWLCHIQIDYVIHVDFYNAATRLNMIGSQW